MKLGRRTFVGGALASGLLAGGCARPLGESIDRTLNPIDPPELGPDNRFIAKLRKIEGEADGTLFAELLDIGTGRSVGLNTDQRFGMCSSFKLSLAAMILARDAAGIDDADRRVTWSADELISYSPYTEDRVASGASLRELAEHTQKWSDNTAANVLLREIGGPMALTGFWRSIGDDVSRLDRYEPALNNVPVTEYRDTTTPAAMARTVAALAYGDVLPEAERATLRQWMVDTPTGARRVREGLAKGWLAGDKTGTSLWPGIGSLYVDIGFVESEARGPFAFATCFRTRAPSDEIAPSAEAALAAVGEVLSNFAEEQDDWPF